MFMSKKYQWLSSWQIEFNLKILISFSQDILVGFVLDWWSECVLNQEVTREIGRKT